jgi:hypothetical protein
VLSGSVKPDFAPTHFLAQRFAAHLQQAQLQ